MKQLFPYVLYFSHDVFMPGADVILTRTNEWKVSTVFQHFIVLAELYDTEEFHCLSIIFWYVD